VKLGKAPTITPGEPAVRYYETTLRPGGKLARDLGYLKQIKDAFVADRKLSEITQAQVANWRPELVTRHGLAPSSANRVDTVLRAIVNKARDECQVDAPTWSLRQLETPGDRVRYLSDADERRLLLALPPHVRTSLRSPSTAAAERASWRHRPGTGSSGAKSGRYCCSRHPIPKAGPQGEYP
jgi:hypothetical protein